MTWPHAAEQQQYGSHTHHIQDTGTQITEWSDTVMSGLPLGNRVVANSLQRGKGLRRNTDDEMMCLLDQLFE